MDAVSVARPADRSKIERVANRVRGNTHISGEGRRYRMDHRIDFDELDRAWHLLRRAAECFDLVARAEEWPTEFSPVRYLVLAKIDTATAYGLSARRLAHALHLRSSTLAYHLDALEGAGLVQRAPWTVHDRRKVAIRLTDVGRYAVRKLGGYATSCSAAMASP